MEITEPVQLVPTNEPEVEREAIGIPEPVRLVPTNEPEVDRKEACSTARANERARSQEEGGCGNQGSCAADAGGQCQPS
ncbi:unnamed protein product [Effrenium voratum]|uniref:Uncharacterized protein n=1 Tax=Effrenium voratum TaxID=2562239 RepID=A0AA36HT44_9DINO|nr:unnamed protein product [Effrenium voratum]